MAQIPLGNFSNVGVQQDVTPTRVVAPDPSDRGAQQVAGALQNIGTDQMQLLKRQNDSIARVKASNALIDREAQVKSITSDLGEKLRTGDLTYDKAEDAYNGAVAKLDPLPTDGLDEATAGEMVNSAKRIQLGQLGDVQRLSIDARNGAAKSDLQSRMDMLGKDAGVPGADVDQINARMDADDIDVTGHLAYGPDWGKVKQDFKDNNWTSHAMQQVASAGNNVGSLQQVQHDLTADDGFYAGKLDANRRTQMLATVSGRITQVQEHNERQGEIRENRAERALLQMDQQAATGIPPDPASLQRWQSTTAGTSVAGEFHDRMNQMTEVQQVLSKPIEVQQQYLEQKRQAMITNGASVAAQANVNRLQTAVDNNLKTMRTDPLTFNAMRTGADVAPLDLSTLGTPAGQQAIGNQIAERFDVVKAVKKAYGPQVPLIPFKAPELVAMRAGYAAADQNTKLQMLAAVGGAAPTGKDAADTIKAIAPDEPLTLLAGMAQYQKLKGPDGSDVAKTLMVGDKVLKDKSVPLPEESLMQAAFDKQVGTAMPAGTPQREQAFQGYKALYAGISDAKGVRYDPTAKVLDDKISQQAVTMATGGVTSRGTGFFGGGGFKVIKPYGMDDPSFNAAVDKQLNALATSSKLPPDQLHDMPLQGVPGMTGSYYLLNAGRVQLDPVTNQPLMVNVK